MNCAPQELLISAITDMIGNDRHIAVGAASPIPGCAALLAQAEARHRMDITILHSRRHNSFTEGARELFDIAAQGRIDTFFLGGVQIDGNANINLVGTGQYPQIDKRFSGSFGSALMYFVVPKVILFREEHSPRTLVKKVDFISAPGSSPKEVYRPGGPFALVTGKAVFHFQKEKSKFELSTLHEGNSLEEVRDQTGFEFDTSREIPKTSQPSVERLEQLRTEVAPKIAEFYPEFARRYFDR